jgi:acyl dehydratase
MSRSPLYLEDLAPGQRFVTGGYHLNPEEARRFAEAYDPQPIHLDPVAAQASPFGGLVVSGWFTAAVTMRLFVEQGPPIAGGMIGLSAEVSWPRATRPGDTVRLSCEVLEVNPSRSRPDRGTVTVRNETLNQRDEVVQLFVGKILVPRRPAPSSP